jgi:hypothetical protein
MPSGTNTVVEPLPHHPEVESLSSAVTAERKMQKIMGYKLNEPIQWH